MWEEIKNIRSSDREIRRFGVLIGSALAGFGFFMWLAGKSLTGVLFVAGILLVGIAAAAPRCVAPLQKLWMAIAIVLGWIVTRVILTVFFYLCLTPIAWIAHLSGKRFLDLSFRSRATTYWRSCAGATRDNARFEKQF